MAGDTLSVAMYLNQTGKNKDADCKNTMDSVWIALVEWPEQCPDAVPENCLRIRITATGENSRQIEAEPCGNFRTITLE